ncbi:MAG: Fe-S cluster assembly ATPase SufC [bacterium]|nr:Fe-S cluster assembly ATPase SufC [bacterium]
MANPLLQVNDLHVCVENKEILKGLNLTINAGEIHAIMGPNGSGKSTLSNALMGHPAYKITQGTIIYKGQEIQDLATDERARRGIFLAFQYPTSIPGVSLGSFLLAAVRSVRGGDIKPLAFRKEMNAKMDELGIKKEFAARYVNEGFSGGEKKRLEVLQMALLKPSLSILDETDSGLDIDALKTVAEGVNRELTAETSALVITHYQRLLDYIKPQTIHILVNGRIVKNGGPELALELEKTGYDELLREYGE